MNRPNITPAEAKAYIDNAEFNIRTAMNEYVMKGKLSLDEANKYISTAIKPAQWVVMVLAIRGYYLNSQGQQGENDRGIYDDALVLIGPSYFQTFNGNTDPRIVKQGVAMLLPGWHEFKQGWHGYGKASGHKAFRTANVREVLPVLRDGQYGIKEGVTVNIHRGGKYNTNSIACQTIVEDQWLEFQRNAYKLMDAEGQKTLPYLLIEEKYK